MELELKDLVYIGIGVAYHIFSAMVGSLESPKENDSRSYRFWFSFLNKLAANWSRAKIGGGSNGNGTIIGQAPKLMEPPKESK